jgi:hypothetical protein
VTAGLAPSLVSGWLNTLRSAGSAYSAVAATYVQLHTGDPGAAGTSNVSVGSTTRNSFTFAASSAGSSLALSSAPSAWTNGGTSETLTHISIWTASTVRDAPVHRGADSQSKAWASADQFTLSTLTAALTPQAA